MNDREGAGSDSGPAFVVPGSTVGPGPIPETTAVWIIRHGETEWSRTGRHTSRTDLPLTPRGEQEAQGLRDLLTTLRPVFVLCSPRVRARRTAELAGLAVDDIDANLAEWDYGDYEGLTTTDIRARVPGWSLWTHPSPHGETPDQVGARADAVLRRTLPYLDRGPVVLVGHGHISRVIGARWIGLSAVEGKRLALGTAAPSVLGAEHATPVLQRWNMPNPAA